MSESNVDREALARLIDPAIYPDINQVTGDAWSASLRAADAVLAFLATQPTPDPADAEVCGNTTREEGQWGSCPLRLGHTAACLHAPTAPDDAVERAARAFIAQGRVDQDGLTVEQQVALVWADTQQREHLRAGMGAALAAAGAGGGGVTAEQVRAAGRRALAAYEAIPYDNNLTGEQVWDILGRAALGIEVQP